MKKIITIAIVLLLTLILFISAMITVLTEQEEQGADKVVVALSNISNLTISENVEIYRNTVKQYAELNGIPEYEDLILAIMQAETGGFGTDVMMSGAKGHNTRFPRTRGGIIDPAYSIYVACKELKDLIDIIGIEEYQNITNDEILLLFQAYHLDKEYISFCKYQYTEETAQAYIIINHLQGREADKALDMQKILSLSGNQGNNIDTSLFLNPEIKNSIDLVTYCKNAYRAKWGYVMGTYGNILTPQLYETKCNQYPDRITPDYQTYIAANYIGIRTADCIGLIKGYMWLDTDTGNINYDTNGFKDWNTGSLFRESNNKGKLVDYPDIGAIVYMEGHVGVYIGDGNVIESAGTMQGVIQTKLIIGKRWTHWIKPDSITYF